MRNLDLLSAAVFAASGAYFAYVLWMFYEVWR